MYVITHVCIYIYVYMVVQGGVLYVTVKNAKHLVHKPVYKGGHLLGHDTA